MLLRRHHVGVILCIFIFSVPIEFDEQHVADRQPDYKSREDSGRGNHFNIPGASEIPKRIMVAAIAANSNTTLIIWLGSLTIAWRFLLRRLIEVASVPGGFRVDEVLVHVAGLSPPQFALVLEDAVHGDAALIRLIHSWSPSD